MMIAAGRVNTVQVWQSYLWSECGVFNMLSDAEAV